MNFAQKIIKHKDTGLYLVILIALAVSLQNYFQGINYFWGSKYTFYNNYIIFKYSFIHLIENKNLYILHLDEHADLYKYSPAFAVCMSLFAFLPDLVGLIIWNTINCLVFYFAVIHLTKNNPQRALFLLGFTLLELILSTQSSQSNSLIAGLIILAFTSLERNKIATAAFFIIAAGFIKLFAFTAVLLFVFYPNKLRAFLFLCLWLILFLLAPLTVISPAELLAQYRNWFEMLSKDHAASVGMSVFSIIFLLFGNVNKIAVLIAGTGLLLLPFLKIKKFNDFRFRAFYLAAILIWIVIFNHKGESPTYIIAMAGCAIWGQYSSATIITRILLIVTWIFTSLIKTDLFPAAAKATVNMNFLNAFMPTIIFLLIIGSLTTQKKAGSHSLSV